VLAHMTNPEGLIICNGYKDASFIETAMLAQKMGLHTIIVVDRFEELETVLDVSKRSTCDRTSVCAQARQPRRRQVAGVGRREGEVRPDRRRDRAGRRAPARGRHARLPRAAALPHRQPDHRDPRDQGRAEGGDAHLHRAARLGAGLQFIDVGGGLAVDYDGSQTNFHSSANYSLQEYANDVVFAVQQACDEKGIAHPDIISESGRALVAHHAILVFDVLGVSEAGRRAERSEASTRTAPSLNMVQILKESSR
jgi:arginine decarboxylase